MDRRSWARGLGLLVATTVAAPGCNAEGPDLDRREPDAAEYTFEDYLDDHVQEVPGLGWIVEGDLLRGSMTEVRREYENAVAQDTGFRSTLSQTSGIDDTLDPHRKLNITYCYMALFPDADGWGWQMPEDFIQTTEDAMRKIELVADVNFVHLDQYDDFDENDVFGGKGMCNPATNDEIYFRIGLAQMGQGDKGLTNFLGSREADGGHPSRLLAMSLARAMTRPTETAETMLHELMHVVGMRHEHVWFPQAEDHCHEPAIGRKITPTDPRSVMFYDSCNGHQAGTAEELSLADAYGLAAAYNLPRRGDPQMLDLTPGSDILWYVPDSSEHVVWRGNANPALLLAEDTLCTDGRPLPCDESPRSPAKGRPFTLLGYGGGLSSLFVYGRGATPDSLLKDFNGVPGNYFEQSVDADLIPLVGVFHKPGGQSDIFWYDHLDPESSTTWHGTGAGSRDSAPRTGANAPRTLARSAVGDFSGLGLPTDILWADPSVQRFFVQTLAPGSGKYEQTSVELGQCHVDLRLPGYNMIVGNFDADDDDEVLHYMPGPGRDVFWPDVPNCETDFRLEVINGSYKPFVGDFSGNGRQEIFWYSPWGPDVIWYFNPDGTYETQPANVSGDYSPYVADFDDDGCDDILWHAPAQLDSPLWMGTCDDDGSFNTSLVTHPQGAYPVGYGPGHGRRGTN